MLHLQTRVHFQEIKAAIARQHKFHCACSHVIHGPSCGHCGCAHACAQCFVYRRAGRFFHHFLVAPLHRAIALADMHHIAVPITKYLNLHMARMQHGFFDEQLAVAKSVARFTARGLNGSQ